VYTRDDLPQEWALVHNSLGAALWELGREASGEEGRKPLKDAEEAYRRALEVYTREQQPQYWALVQCNLGEVLRELGSRTEGPAGVELLSKAEEAWQQALDVYTREQQPEDIASVKQELERTRQLRTQRATAGDSL
jgi:tetratricopeptide (TPR) repeat protein